ncbi:hypothetical protein HK097_005715 [Rhizophlyctis rosea]|uniref:Mannosyltransferase n=1 Tax=Rhizophlyctis rosea TaxID=64517 RepID=A0AAD5SGH2_9FUNG|nr:hypothetical protein HK097_005715 [Rhizophlyctis rosea]
MPSKDSILLSSTDDIGYSRPTPPTTHPSPDSIFSTHTRTLALLFISSLTLRVLNSLFVRTYYDPDEFWQSLEVAHRFVFGYGYLTWEWKEKLRGFSYPLVFANVYKALEVFGLYDTESLILGPRMVQAASASFGDVFTYLLAYRFFGMDAAKWAQILVDVSLVMLFSLALSTLIDYTFYNQWTFVPYTFLRYNIQQNVSIFYGSHPWHWYITQGLPVISLTHLALIIYGATRPNPPDRTLLKLVGWTVFVYSLISHKEFRFIMPVLPPLFAYAGESLRRINLSQPSPNRSWWKRPIGRVMIGIVVLNAIMAYYFSRIHQRGAVEVMHWLRKEVKTWDLETRRDHGILFLMPCHSTPYYAYVHREVDMRFITCEPPLNVDKSKYRDETGVFYDDPMAFFATFFSNRVGNKTMEWVEPKDGMIPVAGQNYTLARYNWPSHIVSFEAFADVLHGVLKGSNYREVGGDLWGYELVQANLGC